MQRKIVLIIDAILNLILAVLLLFFSPTLANFLGVPTSEIGFYPNILGAIFLGISIALVIESYNNSSEQNAKGLGLMGAISINLCGGLALLFWLLFGNLNLPLKGNLFLWILDLLLLIISAFELFNIVKSRKG